MQLETDSTRQPLDQLEQPTVPPLPAAMPLLVILGYSLLLAAAELLTTFADPMLGLLLHMLLLLGLLGLAARWWWHPIHRMLLAFVVSPLIRIMSLSLPLAGLPFISWLLITSIPLFAAVAVTMQVLQLSRHDVGLMLRPGWAPLRAEILIALSGIPLGFLEWFILRPPPLMEGLNLAQVWFPVVVIFISTGLMEELVFRGIMQKTSQELLGAIAIPLVALIFAILHIGYQSWSDFFFVFGVSLFYGWAVQRTGSILGVTISHGLINSMLFIVLPTLTVI